MSSVDKAIEYFTSKSTINLERQKFRIPQSLQGQEIDFGVNFNQKYECFVLVLEGKDTLQKYPISSMVDPKTVRVKLYETYFVAWGEYHEFVGYDVRVKKMKKKQKKIEDDE